MKKELVIERTQRNWSLITDIAYAQVDSWYGATVRDLKLSILMPMNRVPEEKLPLLVWMCGGAFQMMDRNVWIPQWAEFARKGCIVASVEYRTSNEALFPAALQDIKAAIRYLRAHADRYAIDTGRIFAAGESAGGTLACLAGVYGEDRRYDIGCYQEYSSAVSGVIDFYGVTDLVDSMKQNPFLSYTSTAFLGPFSSGHERMTEASVWAQIDEKTPPFLIFHGTNDEMVPMKQSEKLYETLLEKGIPADFYMVKNCGHGAEEFYQEEILETVRTFMTARK